MKRKKRLTLLAKQVAPAIGSTPEGALEALERLERVGLVAVRHGRVVLPMAPKVPFRRRCG